MHKVYYDATNPGSYGGVRPLTRHGPPGNAVKWLSSQDTYTLHKPVRKKFIRRKTFSKGPNDLLQADLVDMQSFSRFNDGYRYILTCIDVFTKKGYAIPLKDKRGSSLVIAFEKILENIRPVFIQTDQGTEFLNSEVQNLFKKYNIHHYWSYNMDIKAAVVERFNRTIKTRMYRYFTAHYTNRWVDVLQQLVDSYNASYHRTIGMTPNDVTNDNAQVVAERMYPLKTEPRWKYNLDDKVRIVKYKHVFIKGFVQNWTDEIFLISERHASSPVTYSLTDLDGESIKGKFYEQEIQKIDKKDDDVFIVEKVLKTRRRNGRVEHYVKWRGYADKFNSWTTDLGTI